jgi:hypothetical protein
MPHTALTPEKINALMLAAHAKAKAAHANLVRCPLGHCDWSRTRIEDTAKHLRRHLIADH